MCIFCAVGSSFFCFRLCGVVAALQRVDALLVVLGCLFVFTVAMLTWCLLNCEFWVVWIAVVGVVRPLG